MSEIDFISVCSGLPKEVGWYAVLYCWEPQEGYFPAGVYWDGKVFDTQLPITNWLDIHFDDFSDALTHACDNDPNW